MRWRAWLAVSLGFAGKFPQIHRGLVGRDLVAVVTVAREAIHLRLIEAEDLHAATDRGASIDAACTERSPDEFEHSSGDRGRA